MTVRARWCGTPAARKVPPRAPVRLHARLQPEERPPAHLRVKRAALGRAARRDVSSARRIGKGKVESAIGHTQSTPLKGLRFASLEEAQAYLDRWEARWADTRIHGTTKRQVAAMFTEEQPHLRPLPLEPFRYYQYGLRTVHLDGCVEVAGAYYAPPPGWLGRVVAVQWDDHHVRLLDSTTGLLLREHRRHARGRHVIHPDDQSVRTPPSTLALLSRAARAGDAIGTLCAAIHRRDGERGVRRVLGVLALVKKHGEDAEDAAH